MDEALELASGKNTSQKFSHQNPFATRIHRLMSTEFKKKGIVKSSSIPTKSILEVNDESEKEERKDFVQN